MRLTTSGRRARARMVAALLSVSVCGGALNWGHFGGDDPGCTPTLVQHDESAHRFTSRTQTPTSSSDHCTLCHFFRLLHTALSSKFLAAGAASHVGARCAPKRLFAPAIFALNVPSRAPPAAAFQIARSFGF